MRKATILGSSIFLFFYFNAFAQVCPPGTQTKGQLPPKGFAKWCLKDGKRHGPFQGFYSNGKKAVITHFKNGKRNGIHRSYFPDGSLEKAGKFKHGKLNGTWTRWYSGGGKKDRGQWAMGKPTGKWRFWRDNGDIRGYGSYICGKKSGTWVIAKKNSTQMVNKNYATLTGCTSYTKLDLLSFEASQLAAFQEGGGGNTFTMQLTWTPRYRIWSWLSLTGRIGVSLFKGSTENNRFLVMDYGGLFQLHPSYLGNFSLSLGLGGMTWLGYFTHPIVNSMIAYHFNKKFLGLIDRLFLGGSVFLFPYNNVDLLRLGVGITL